MQSGYYTAINTRAEGSATKQKWHPRFQDLKISLRSQDFSGISKSHIDFKISLRFQRISLRFRQFSLIHSRKTTVPQSQPRPASTIKLVSCSQIYLHASLLIDVPIISAGCNITVDYKRLAHKILINIVAQGHTLQVHVI